DSTNMPWYKGGSVLFNLETVYIGNDHNHIDARFPVQWVIRPQSNSHHDFRGFAGRVAGGVFKTDDEVVVLPSGFSTKIKGIHTFEGEIEQAFSPMSVTFTLNDEIDISRGDMIVKANNPPQVTQDIEAMICWFSDAKLNVGGKYILRHTTRECRCIVKDLRYKVNVNTLHKIEGEQEMALNDVGRIVIRASQPLFVDSYQRNRLTGSLILID